MRQARNEPGGGRPGRRELSSRVLLIAAVLVPGCGGDATGPLPPPGDNLVVTITAGPESVRQGDVVRFTAVVTRADGSPSSTPVVWSLSPTTGGLILSDGRFVGYEPGVVTLTATAGTAAASVQVTVEARGLSGTFSVLGQGPVLERWTSDLWAFGNVVYTGTWSCRAACGNRLYVWDVSNPAQPAQVGFLSVDATVTNDVKIRADGTLAVLTHEGSSDGANGITILDTTNPLQPTVITRFTQNMAPGVHNVWVEGNFVYVVVDGTQPGNGSGLQVVDVSDPSNPAIAASFFGGIAGVGGQFLHDVYVRDGLAFLSHWNAGLVILDVGNGVAGGTPENPAVVSSVLPNGGADGPQVHNAWYWPDGGYVFVGSEDFGGQDGQVGFMHVIDARDLRNPREVATFAVPGTTPHNFWLDEANQVLYLAWYTNGLRALDVSGELLGELHRQGREIASIQYDGAGGLCPGLATCTWAPQLHNGLLFVSDMNSGLWVLRLDR